MDYKEELKKIRSRHNRVNNLWGEFERIHALKLQIDRDRESDKRRGKIILNEPYYADICDRMKTIVEKLNIHLPEIEK